MNDKRFAAMLASLPDLNPTQVKELRTRLDYLNQNGEVGTKVKADWLTAGMLSELKRRGLVAQGMPDAALATVVGSKYWGRCSAVRKALLDRAGRPLNAAERAALGRIVGRALAEWLAERAPLGLKTLFTNIDNTLVAVEDAFPGYIEARQLRLVIELRA